MFPLLCNFSLIHRITRGLARCTIGVFQIVQCIFTPPALLIIHWLVAFLILNLILLTIMSAALQLSLRDPFK